MHISVSLSSVLALDLVFIYFSPISLHLLLTSYFLSHTILIPSPPPCLIFSPHLSPHDFSSFLLLLISFSSTSGTVVILRNRFEDVKMGHKILTSPIDGIKSHFKTSYGLTVKLLETKTLEECRALIERGFGAYLLQKKVLKKFVYSSCFLCYHISCKSKKMLHVIPLNSAALYLSYCDAIERMPRTKRWKCTVRC